MKALVRARLEVIEEKQSACVSKLNALAGTYPSMMDDKLPVKVQPRGHNSGSLLKFPVSKPVSKPVPTKDRRTNLFTGLSVRG